MDLFSKNRLLFWLMIALIVINVAALATFYLRSNVTVGPAGSKMNALGRAELSKELSLSPKQAGEVSQINQKFRIANEPLFQNLQSKKSQLIDELSKPATDTNKVIKLADEIGLTQREIQLSNARQFLELKKICNPEQTSKLAEIYLGLYGCGQKGKGPGQGNSQGMHRHRYGRSQPDSIVTPGK